MKAAAMSMIRRALRFVRRAADETAQPAVQTVPTVEQAARNLSVKQQLQRERARVDALTDIIRTMARQLNNNTVMMQRWVKNHHELNVIEHRHIKNVQKLQRERAQAGGQADGSSAEPESHPESQLVVPDRKIVLVSR